MNTLAAAVLVSLSSLCSVSDAARKEDTANDGQPPVAADSQARPEWCTCALSVEETVFLQQYDFE